MTGTRLGQWILGECLGSGPLGSLYAAQAAERLPDHPAHAAVKVIHPARAQDSGLAQRLPSEVLALHRLTHPNLARFYDSGSQAGTLFYARELAEGVSLAQIASERPDWQHGFFRVAIQVARALKHAHHRSILHRDLKPSNIILARDGNLKVTDFGIAKAFAVPPLALSNEPMGTICYLAPEHFTGKPLTRRSDLYALGGVLYTLVCGRPPFAVSSAAEAMHKHCYMLPDRPVNFVPKLPGEIDDLICTLLAKDPARRPASAAALLEDLEHLRSKLERKGETLLLPPQEVDPTGQHAPLTLTSTPPLPEGNDSARARERLLRAIVLAAAFLIVLSLILFVLFRPRPSAIELWQKAQPLLQSDNPADWEKARSDYLDLIERWHPEELKAEREAVRQRIADERELQRAFKQSRAPLSEPERLYRQGLAFASIGDITTALAAWEKLLAMPELEPRWRELARRAMERFSITTP